MNVSFSKTYNEQEYSVVCYIINNDLTLTSPELNSDQGTIYPISTAGILYIMIENSMAEFVPKLVLEFRDENSLLTNKIKSQNSKVKITIGKKTGSSQVALDLNFIIKSFRITEIFEKTITYSIQGELDNSIQLNTLCEYATVSSLETDNETLENPYEILRNILTQAGYKLYPTEEKLENGDVIQSRHKMPYTNELCHYITKPNTKVIDAAYYLLSYGVGETGTIPPAYLIHNLKDNKAFITSCENMWSADYINKQPQITRMGFGISENVLNDRTLLLRNVSNNNYTGGVDFAKLFFNFKFYEFDQESRTWENYDISKTILDDTLTKGMNHSTESSLYLKMNNEDFHLAKYYGYGPHNHPIMYDVMRQLELYSSNLIVTIDQGDLELDVGQVISITDKGTEDSQIEQFFGNWLITKIQHSFKNQKYECHLVCSRRFFKTKKTI